MSENNDLLNKIISNLEYQKQVFGDNYYSEKVEIPIREISTENSEKIEEPVEVEVPVPAFSIQEEEMPKKSTIDTDWKNSKELNVLYDKIHNCLECELGQTRNEFVFGSGNPNADLLIIGEAPGADEDKQGLPFVGRAGQLLTKIIEAINFTRDDVYIANIIKCRPPNNRRPKTDEVEKCEPYLQKQIELIDPKFILALGKTAIDTLLKKDHTMRDIRGEFMDYNGRKLMVTYHPAALLRNPNWKRPVWEDVKKLRAAYDEIISN